MTTFRRRVISGDGRNTTAIVAEALRTHSQFNLATLYLIGDPDDPRAIWLTDWDAPLRWPVWGTFQPAVISRSALKRKIGWQVDALDIEWSPPDGTLTADLSTANPYQRAQVGEFDNWPFRMWVTYMPTPGDANTWGASEEFGGRIGDLIAERGKIQFKVNSFIDVVDLQVPTNVIELTNTLAAYSGPTPPVDHDSVPHFSVIAGSSQTKLILHETSPTAGASFADNVLRGGYIVFSRGPGQTLGGMWSAIYANRYVDGNNEVVIYNSLPWPPTAGVDTCYISSRFPLERDEGDFQGFPFVPSPGSSL